LNYLKDPNVELILKSPRGLTNRSSQPLAVAVRTFSFIKQFLVFAALAAVSGGSAPSR
jgi:hypothetical protein